LPPQQRPDPSEVAVSKGEGEKFTQRWPCLPAAQLRCRCPPLATSSQDSRNRDFACTGGSKCRNGHQVAYRRSQPVGGGKIDDDPPDFILKSGDQDGTPPTRTQME
jgi:hypothetical protein